MGQTVDGVEDGPAETGWDQRPKNSRGSIYEDGETIH
jgi:hypothetical protein